MHDGPVDARWVAELGRAVTIWVPVFLVTAERMGSPATALLSASLLAIVWLYTLRSAFGAVPYTLGPAVPASVGTLTGLVKRALPDVEALALKTPDDLEAARDMVARHARESGLSQNPTWRLVVAPAKGTVAFTSLDVGTAVTRGDTVATVVTLRDRYEVVAPHGGRVVEWLVEDGDPVAPGQPIVRLHPEESRA